ncbi:MAG: HD-GYP domain-containing protein [Nitrospiraceae bacterium]|nr:MAG: HD-GYP domain-containing protein [Nitrospiraceae bacterium]
MIKKISTKYLRAGMYIKDLNCSWLNHPFFGSSLKVRDDETVEKILKYGIREVYIDTDKGLDVIETSLKQELKKQTHEELTKIAERKLERNLKITVNKEIVKARKIKTETIRTIKKIMNDVKLGKPLERSMVEKDVDSITESVFRNEDALMGLGRLRKINEYTYSHSMSVCVLMVSFTKHLGFEESLIREIGIGAILHDVGTSRIPADILKKKSTLTDEEYEMIKKHVQYGREIMEQTAGMSDISIITAYEHHERLDGSGYPNNLKGDEISILGQAMGIVDVYDALTTKRSYRGRTQPTEALRMIYGWGGTRFNFSLVQEFIRCIGIYPVGTLVSLESGLLGVVINHGEEDMLKPVVRIIYNTKNEKYITMPYDLDLADEGENGDRIVNYESPDKWNLQPEVYL